METIQAIINDEIQISIPIHFGRYDYIRSIGSGSFSVVALVNERGTNNQFACKICSRQHLMQKNIFDRFEREVRIMQSFNHPSLVALYDVVYDQNLIYLIMEYCQNGELFQVIANNGRLDEDSARRIFIQIVSGMVYIHSRGIAHRDLKPENVFVDAESNIKLGDFGLSHDRNGNHLLSTLCGTLYYSAPEIINHQNYDGAKADIWSLGCMVFELATNEYLFDPNDIDDDDSRSSTYQDDIRHLSMIEQVIGPIPQDWAREGTNYEHLYSNGDLLEHNDPPLPELERLLLQKGVPKLEAMDLLDFIIPMLSIIPAKRPSAEELLQSPWLHDL